MANSKGPKSDQSTIKSQWKQKIIDINNLIFYWDLSTNKLLYFLVFFNELSKRIKAVEKIYVKIKSKIR